MANQIIIPDINPILKENDFNHYPNIAFLKAVIGLEPLHQIAFTTCDYLNALFNQLNIIEANKEDIWATRDYLLKNIGSQPITDGEYFKYLLLFLINEKTCNYDYDNGDINKWIEFPEIHKLFYNLYYWWSDGIIPLSKRGFFIFNKNSSLASFISIDWLCPTPQRHIEFNVEVYNSMKSKKLDYEPVAFFNLLYEFIEIIKINYLRPELIISGIKTYEDDDTFSTEYAQTKLLLYWLLLAIKFKIGFEDWKSKDKEAHINLNLLYKILNNEAKILGCSPDMNPEAPEFPIEVKENQLANETIKPLTSNFKLSDKKGANTDLVRILTAMHGLNLIEFPNGIRPSQKQFIEAAGQFFGADLSTFDQTLNQARNNVKPETNKKFFERMGDIFLKENHKE